MSARLVIDVDIDTVAALDDDVIRQALARTSTHNPFDEIEGHLWAELNDRGIDAIVSVLSWEVERP